MDNTFVADLPVRLFDAHETKSDRLVVVGSWHSSDCVELDEGGQHDHWLVWLRYRLYRQHHFMGTSSSAKQGTARIVSWAPMCKL
jgi:hypothetical protein